MRTVITALAIFAALSILPERVEAQGLRPDIRVCGNSSRLGADLYSGIGTFNEIQNSCDPDSDTQTLFVERGGSVGGKGAAWLDYLNNGGVIITEYTKAEDVYNEIYGTSYVQPGSRDGDCRDNAMPSLKFNTDSQFWQDVNLPVTPESDEACGYPIDDIVNGEAEVLALGGWASTGAVNFAARSQGAGILWLLEADWQDNEQYYTDDSKLFMGALMAGGIPIERAPVVPVPTLGFAGMALLILGTLLLARRRRMI